MEYIQFVENGICFNEDGIGRKNRIRFEVKKTFSTHMISSQRYRQKKQGS